MYQYPFGDGQRLNLNWIINEIIQLRKQLDPDYTEPSFSQIYPFSDTQQLNLDWILSELKALKELAPEPTPAPEIDLDEIGKALLAAEYDASKSYQKNDYITRDGEILRATAATTGTYDSTKWQAVKLGDDLAIITRWASAMDAYINSLKASQVANDSTVDGVNVDDALSTLKGAITSIQQHKHKIIFLGDSYGAQSESWVNYCAAFMSLASSDYINKCKSGGGFIFDPDVGEGGNAFLNQLMTVTADRNTYTDIVCCGGINDARGSQYMSNIYPNIRAFISYAHTNFPNAEIHIGFIGSALQNSSVIGVKKYQNRMLALQEYVKAASPYYMSGIENAIHTSESNYGDDRFHPSASGARYVGLCIANAITNNYCDVRNNFKVSLTRSNTTISTNSIDVDITGDYAIITIPESFFAQFSSAQNIGRTSGNRINFTISGDLYFDQQVTVESFVQITRNGTGEILPCIWWFDGKTIGVNIESLANGSWETISTNYVYVNAPINVVIPIQKIN